MQNLLYRLHLLHQCLHHHLAISHPHCTIIHSPGVDAVLRHAQDIVYTFALSTMSRTKVHIVTFFPMYGFRVAVCASTRDNQYNCALPNFHKKTFFNGRNRIYISQTRHKIHQSLARNIIDRWQFISIMIKGYKYESLRKMNTKELLAI